VDGEERRGVGHCFSGFSARRCDGSSGDFSKPGSRQDGVACGGRDPGERLAGGSGGTGAHAGSDTSTVTIADARTGTYTSAFAHADTNADAHAY
jgi:hypothetical protein